MVTGSWDRTLRLWQLRGDGGETKSMETMEGHTASVLCLEMNGDRVASGSLGGEVWSLLEKPTQVGRRGVVLRRTCCGRLWHVWAGYCRGVRLTSLKARGS